MVAAEKLLRQLIVELEREMRALGQWTEIVPDADALASTIPFCYDKLPFNEWLQWVFLPRIEQLLELRQTLPSQSDIAPLAKVWFEEQGIAQPAERLLQLIREIDSCLSNEPQDALH